MRSTRSGGFVSCGLAFMKLSQGTRGRLGKRRAAKTKENVAGRWRSSYDASISTPGCLASGKRGWVSGIPTL
eukprot:6203620-Pleurochrysis_carterae.AAC.2